MYSQKPSEQRRNWCFPGGKTPPPPRPPGWPHLGPRRGKCGCGPRGTESAPGLSAPAAPRFGKNCGPLSARGGCPPQSGTAGSPQHRPTATGRPSTIRTTTVVFIRQLLVCRESTCRFARPASCRSFPQGGLPLPALEDRLHSRRGSCFPSSMARPGRLRAPRTGAGCPACKSPRWSFVAGAASPIGGSMRMKSTVFPLLGLFLGGGEAPRIPE